MPPATRYALVEVFTSFGCDYKMICWGDTPGDLFRDMAGIVASAFEQACENNQDQISLDFEFQAYQEAFDDNYNGQPSEWSCHDLIALMPHLLSDQVDAIANGEADTAWGDWSELCQWVTDGLRNGDGIQFGPDLDMPSFAKWLLDWEQDRWQENSPVPAWWLSLRDLLKDRRWWASDQGLRQFREIIQDGFNERHSL